MRKRLFVLVSAALIGACAPSFQPNKIQRMRFEPAQQAERRGDHATALEIYEDAAEDGIAYAQYRLARLYENGKGTDQDYVQAARWYARSTSLRFAANSDCGHPSTTHVRSSWVARTPQPRSCWALM